MSASATLLVGAGSFGSANGKSLAAKTFVDGLAGLAFSNIVTLLLDVVGGSATAAMANLAEAIQGLVVHMRGEQQLIREWVDAQAVQHREIRRLLEILAHAPAQRD